MSSHSLSLPLKPESEATLRPDTKLHLKIRMVSLRKLRRSVLALGVEMITDFSQQSVEIRLLSSLLEIRGLSRDDEARKS